MVNLAILKQPLGRVVYQTMEPSASRSRSRSSGPVNRALRARQLRRFHKHIQDVRPNETNLLSAFTDAVLEQIDFLLDAPNWEAVPDGEKEYEDSWLKKGKSLASQLTYIKRWYAEKKEKEEEDLAAAAVSVDAAIPTDVPPAHAAPAARVASAAQAQPPVLAQGNLDANTNRQETDCESPDRLGIHNLVNHLPVRPGPPAPSTLPPRLPLAVAQPSRRSQTIPTQHAGTPAITPAAQLWQPNGPSQALFQPDLEEWERQHVDAQQQYRQVHPEYIHYLKKRKAASLRERSLERASATLDKVDAQTAEQRRAFGDARRAFQLAKRAVKKKSAADDNDGPDPQLDERLAESGRRLYEAYDALAAVVRENVTAYDEYSAADEASRAAFAVEEDAFRAWERMRLALLRIGSGRPQ